MPLTFPSHAAAVLPIKLAWPHRWDGVALVIGSTSPDLPYAVYPYLRFDAHAWTALLWFCVPVTVLGVWIVRRAAPAVAAHLPDLGGFALHDYAVLGRVRRAGLRAGLGSWLVTVGSAFVGALSHLVWDSFTHPRGIGILRFPPLGRVAFDGLPWWHVLQLASTVAGALVTAALAWRIGRRRLLVAWHGAPPEVARRPGVFWSAAAAVGAPGLAVIPLLAGSRLSAVLGVRLLVVGAVALLAGSAAVRSPAPRSPGRPGPHR
jgi:hypothetical protein